MEENIIELTEEELQSLETIEEEAIRRTNVTEVRTGPPVTPVVAPQVISTPSIVTPTASRGAPSFPAGRGRGRGQPAPWRQDPTLLLQQVLGREAMAVMEMLSIILSGSNLTSREIPLERDWSERLRFMERELQTPPPDEAYGIVPKGGGILFLNTTWVISELNRIFGKPNWSSQIRAGPQPVSGNYVASLTLQIRWPNGAVTVQHDVGTQAVPGQGQVTTGIKGSVSSGIKRCARQLGNHFMVTNVPSEVTRLKALLTAPRRG